MAKTVFLQTYGCQMNERDSEEVLGMLGNLGYDRAEAPEAADVVLLNTCSVREHAEERAFGKMWEMKTLKRQRPELVLGIIGCMAKAQRDVVFKRLPFIDLVAGPAELYDLPMLIAEIQDKRRMSDHLLAIDRKFRPLDQKPASVDYRREGVTAFVTIMEGCDKRCTYCIVPTTRGQEISRPAEEIIAEIRSLTARGFKEITLLGQNVNSYGKRFPDGSGFQGPLGRLRMLNEQPEQLLDFAALLRRIDAEAPAPRLRFTTSHPFDATERLFEALRDCRSACEWLHLPVQSGSSRLLRAMRRGYTREAYLEKIARLRQLIPDVSLSTDIIVGFPGETDDDFQQTLSLLRDVAYDNAYIFKYSPRPGTDAAAWVDDVPQDVKEDRNQALLAAQEEISLTRFARYEGRTVEALIEGPGKKPGQVFGRTRGNHGVIVDGPESLVGQLVEARIARATPRTLFGELR